MASVLLIEDDQRIRETLARSLTDGGHAVRTEGRGADALSVVVDWRPDVVVLDLGLPDLDGTDVLHMVRSVDDGGPGIADATVLHRGRSAAGSTGLGLDIAASSARAAGGELRVERSPLGGARVILDVPAAEEAA